MRKLLAVCFLLFCVPASAKEIGIEPLGGLSSNGARWNLLSKHLSDLVGMRESAVLKTFGETCRHTVTERNLVELTYRLEEGSSPTSRGYSGGLLLEIDIKNHRVYSFEVYPAISFH